MKVEKGKDVGAVVIGASIGAVEALLRILPELPDDYPLPVLVVVHVPPDGRSALPELFRERCRMPVKEAEDTEAIRAGTIYFAPSDYHLLVDPDCTVSLSNEEAVHYSRPAIDPLFETAADAWGDRLLGVVLTGASKDGALGLRAVESAGGATLVQDPETAEGMAMPMAALEACQDARSLSLDEIAQFIANEFPLILK
ncbi:chemotaxis protein CheB [Haloferula chungangensis]|uniref:protein-glutamate methylesterase n=1 Tax=Haloferula chungangensis TaxID=1048331 RepID=A0ABW2L269_9BACT